MRKKKVLQLSWLLINTIKMECNRKKKKKNGIFTLKTKFKSAACITWWRVKSQAGRKYSSFKKRSCSLHSQAALKATELSLTPLYSWKTACGDINRLPNSKQKRQKRDVGLQTSRLPWTISNLPFYSIVLQLHCLPQTVTNCNYSRI